MDERRGHVRAATGTAPRDRGLVVAPFASVKSPRAPALIAKIGRSGARPLATMISPSLKIGVGAVIFELPPSRHNSLPVRGS